MQLFVIKLLLVLFLVLLFAVCRKKGFRSLLALGLTAVILVKVFLPLLINGHNPAFLAFVLSVPILCLIMYLTEGWTRFSHVAVISTLINFGFTGLLSWGAITLGGFTGLTSEEDAYVTGYGIHSIDLQSLLIAGIVLGTLGVLTEMVVTQTATVAELVEGGQNQDTKQIFKQAYTIGVAHLGSMLNTLFLIYAGVSLPILIILFEGFGGTNGLLSSELFLTEIVRTLVGVIGLIVAMPVSTALAVRWLEKKK